MAPADRDDLLPVYTVPVIYEMIGKYVLRGHSLEEAILNAAEIYPKALPNDSHPLEDSVLLDEWQLARDYPDEWKAFVEKHGEEFGLKSPGPDR
jgi:hypothetical protein